MATVATLMGPPLIIINPAPVTSSLISHCSAIEVGALGNCSCDRRSVYSSRIHWSLHQKFQSYLSVGRAIIFRPELAVCLKQLLSLELVLTNQQQRPRPAT